jgi:hypothetical protein
MSARFLSCHFIFLLRKYICQRRCARHWHLQLWEISKADFGRALFFLRIRYISARVHGCSTCLGRVQTWRHCPLGGAHVENSSCHWVLKISKNPDFISQDARARRVAPSRVAYLPATLPIGVKRRWRLPAALWRWKKHGVPRDRRTDPVPSRAQLEV